MMDMGVPNVLVLKGGIDDWLKGGYPVAPKE